MARATADPGREAGGAAERPAAGLKSVDPLAGPSAHHRERAGGRGVDPNVQGPRVGCVAEPLGELDDVPGLAQVVAALAETGSDRAVDRYPRGAFEYAAVGVVFGPQKIHPGRSDLDPLASLRERPDEERSLLEGHEVPIGRLLADADLGADLARSHDHRGIIGPRLGQELEDRERLSPVAGRIDRRGDGTRGHDQRECGPGRRGSVEGDDIRAPQHDPTQVAVISGVVSSASSSTTFM